MGSGHGRARSADLVEVYRDEIGYMVEWARSDPDQEFRMATREFIREAFLRIAGPVMEALQYSNGTPDRRTTR